MVAKPTRAPAHNDIPSSTDVSLREYMKAEFAALRTLIDERDRQYSAQFRAAEVAVTAALAAQKEQVTSAFSASEKAIVKAELAQSEYNSRSNEFRAQLGDQARTLMPRTETDVRFAAIDDKLAAIVIANDGKLEALRASSEKATEANSSDIKGLRESRAQVGGSHDSSRELWAYLLGAIGATSTIILLLLRLSGH